MWGCGSGCVTVAVVDARSGEVWFAPFAFEDGWKDDRVVCHHGSSYELTSELLVIQGNVKGKIGTHFYRWANQKFSLLHYDEACSP
jgi:hypothetical protein